jgi:Rieske Fe-S protein
MKRRELLVIGSAAALGSATACALLRGGASHTTIAAPIADGKIHLKKSAIPPGEALQLSPGKPHDDVLVAALKSGGWVAATANCTHKGCVVDWSQDVSEWQCPCHGSRFGTDGAVKEGPAESSLKQYKVSEEGDELVIDLG